FPTRRSSDLTIKRDLPGEPLPIKADLDFMKQALLNVVLNGIQAMPQGGQLTISAHRDDNAVVAEVCDRGVGIAQEVQDKIFELYFTTKKDGNGIGLAQTYQILQWHYGSVEFESTEGEGTTFRFRLPLASSTLDSELEAAVLGIYLLSLGCLSPGWLPPAVRGFVAQRAEQPPAVTSSDSTQQSQGSV